MAYNSVTLPPLPPFQIQNVDHAFLRSSHRSILVCVIGEGGRAEDVEGKGGKRQYVPVGFRLYGHSSVFGLLAVELVGVRVGLGLRWSGRVKLL